MRWEERKHWYALLDKKGRNAALIFRNGFVRIYKFDYKDVVDEYWACRPEEEKLKVEAIARLEGWS